MTRHDQLTRLTNGGVVAVMRAPRGDVLVDVAEALSAGGIEAMEVTFTVPKAEKVIEKVADRLGNRILLGAGTVLDSETARIAMMAGAEFIVSPITRLDVIEICHRYDKLVMPGALTPTEVVTAWDAGADIVKVFPSDFGGPPYLKALKAPLPQVRLMPTGGVDLNTAEEFLRAGASVLGVGGALVSAKALAESNLHHIEQLARQYVSIVESFRGET